MSVFLKKTIKISLLLLFIFSIANIVFAQQTILTSMSSISLSSSPSSPRAGDSVKLTVISDSIDLNSATIVWYIDSVIKKDATGKDIIIKTKSDGGNTTIRAVVETSDGIIKESTKVIST